MGIIYKITSPSTKVYVGKTYNLRKRKSEHQRQAKKGRPGKLYNSIRKYGWAAHVLEIIEEVRDELLNEREMFWIAELHTYCYDNPNGLNMTKGGEGQRSTWMHDDKRRKEQSAKFSKEGNPFYGKKHSDEYKRVRSVESRKYNIENGIKIAEWAAEKGRSVIRKPILCYDQSGRFISEYVSATEAALELDLQRSSIVESCKEKISGVEGKYVFRYKTDNYPLKIEVGSIKTKTVRRPVVLLNEDFEPVIEFSCAEEASEFLDVPKTTINRAAQYNYCKPTRLGHVFLYRDMYDEFFKEVI